MPARRCSFLALAMAAALHACASDRGEDTTSDAAAPDASDAAAPDSSVPPNCEPPTSGSGCSGFSAIEVTKFVYCRESVPEPYVPAGFYAEPFGSSILRWSEPCSPSLAETHARASKWGNSTTAPGAPFEILSDSGTDFYFEAVVRFYNATATGDALTYAYRNTRCDYFDGATLKGAPFESTDAIGKLAGYLWFVNDGRVTGSHILGHSTSFTSTQAVATLCHTKFVHGDWNQCDQIEVLETDYVLDRATGSVAIHQPIVAVSASGECH